MMGRLQIVHSGQIKHIRVNSSGPVEFKKNAEFLKTFKCVREFDCCMNDLSGMPVLIGLIDEYRELKTLSVQTVQRYKQPLNVEPIEQLRRHLETARPDVELYLNGLLSKHFNELKRFPQNGCLESSNKLEFYLQNHQSTSKFLRQFHFLSYDRWEPFELRGKIPSGFLQKLVNLSSIALVGKANDPNRLANLLSECERIESLSLINSSLGQTFYSKLSSYVPYLEELTIEDDPALLESLDFHFLFEFNNLYHLRMKRPLDLNLAYRFFMGSITAQTFDFTIDDRPAYLVRLGSEDIRHNDPTDVDNANLKAWASQLAVDYNEKYGVRLSVGFELPVQFVFSYGDVDYPD